MAISEVLSRRFLRRVLPLIALSFLFFDEYASPIEAAALYNVVVPRSAAREESGRKNVQKLDPKTKEVPFAGLAAKSREEQDQALAGLSPDDLYNGAKELERNRMFADGIVLLDRALSTEASDDVYIKSLGLYQTINVRLSDNEPAYARLAGVLEKALQERADSWRVVRAVAKLYDTFPTTGYMEDGEFVYSYNWRQDMLSCADRLRVQRARLYAQILPLVRAEAQKLREFYDSAPEYIGKDENSNDPEKQARWRDLQDLRLDIKNYYNEFSDIFNRQGNEYWLMQKLTDIETLPETVPAEHATRRGRNTGAPVDADGNPIFYAIPESFEAAKNDGERVFALQEELMSYDRNVRTRGAVLLRRASDALTLFGVQTLAGYDFFFKRNAADSVEAEAGIWALNTLKDSETIARLANGVKRFDLPAQYDYIGLWTEALEYLADKSGVLSDLANEYQNRRQYDKAVDIWKRAIEEGEGRFVDIAKEAVSQICDPRVSIDSTSSVYGTNVDLALRYRNAVGAKVTVRALNVDTALNTIRDDAYWQKEGNGNLSEVLQLAIANELGVERSKIAKTIKSLFGKKKLVGEEVASYTVQLDPDPDHYDKVRKLDFPISEPGAYLVEVEANDGNKDVVVVWLRETAIVFKPFGDGWRCFALDAKTGAPLPDTEVEFFVVATSWYNGKRKVKTNRFKETTDSNGSILIAGDKIEFDRSSTQILAVVPSRSKGDRAAAQFGFKDSTRIWRIFENEDRFDNTRAFFISDRPIYRPKQTAHFQFIVGTAQYDSEDLPSWAGQEVVYRITSPMGEEVAKKRVTLDENGAFADTFELSEDAKLGVYYVQLADGFENGEIQGRYYGDGTFRLEEYRKPEFQVTVDAPKDPVALGDKFKAKVNAKYYFGAPVADADVSYRVTRTTYRSKFYPSRYWDWFYGVGYWQFTYDSPWYPGWNRWGCMRLIPSYMPYNNGVPEVVAEGEARIDAEGNFEIEIDSSLAKAIYPNDDHQYSINVEVTDNSRRTIVGNGNVIVAREPFKTYVWFNRGYYRVGDKMTMEFQARRLDGKGVEGAAVAKLYKIAYEKTDDGTVKPIETEVFAEELKTDAEGRGSVAMTASEPGQYRASCVVTTPSGVVEEGAQLILIGGVEASKIANADFRFNALEIVPDKPEYAVGDVAHIQITSNAPNAYVLWTERPVNGVTRGEPQFVKLEKGVAYVDVPIETADQPNIFVQATTVFDGKLHQEQRELAVPPEKRVFDVAVEPVKDRVRPGEKAPVKLRLTDPEGNPVVGQTVVTVYDKSLEAISGGSNVEDIREFFWKWPRYSNLQSIHNLEDSAFIPAFHLINPDPQGKDVPMRDIGVFGNRTTVTMGGGMGGGAFLKSYGRARRAERDGAMALNMATDAAVAEESMEMEVLAAAPMMDAAPMDAAKQESKRALAGTMIGGLNDAMTDRAASEEAGAVSETLVEAVVRSNLADLAYWAVDLKPNDDGVIEIEIDMPDNLTTWKIAAWTVGEGLRVGSGESEIVTSKDLIVRMQKPRFLTQKDEPVFTANVHNYLSSEKTVQVSLETTDQLAFAEGVRPVQNVVVPANGEARVDWTLKAVGCGDATVVMKALTDEESDAIQETISIKEHGILKQIPVSGIVPPADPNAEDQDAQKVRESSFTLTIPEERRNETTTLTVRFSPTLAGAVFDALPYMIEYPYGCTEQTLNRFLPLVLAQRSLMDAGVDLAALKDKRVNLNAQELGDAQERAKQWGKRRTALEPVFDIAQVRSIAQEGVAKLQSMQVSDGGFGWFSGPGERSSAYLTALVVRGLVIAQQCDQTVDPNTIERAKQWLLNYERDQVVRLIRGKVWTDEEKQKKGADYKYRADSTDVAVYAALAELGIQPSGFSEDCVDYDNAKLAAKDQFAIHAVMKEFIWEARNEMALYPLSAFGIALTQEPDASDDTKLRVETILRALSQYRAVDDENQTAHLDLNRYQGWCFWRWDGAEYETQAYYLRLLQRVDASTLEKLGLQDDAPRMIKYLLNNRKNATYWRSTRDTAFCVEAFVEYLNKTNELAPNASVEVLVDGEVKKTVEYTPDNIFLVDGTLELGPDELTSGEHTVTLRVNGGSPLYYNAYLEYFTLEDPIAKAGLELKTERRYYKLVERENAVAAVEGGHGQAVDQRVEIYDRVPLQSGDAIKSGDKIEVELLVESKNEYESILLEDLKPAGFEPVEQLSGYNGNSLGAYVEYRDDRVCFFCTRLSEGGNAVKYVLRAETPGKFSALPTKIWAMYAPELKGNADEFKTVVEDRQ